MTVAHRIVAVVLTVSVFLMSTSVASAQVPVLVANLESRSPGALAPGMQPAGDTLAAGLLEGEALAEQQPTGGRLGVGLAVGVFTGLIGTGIGYFVIGPEQLSAEAVQRGVGKSADFQLGLKTGWEKKTQSKKRGAFLGGGLIGTAIWIAILASGNSGE